MAANFLFFNDLTKYGSMLRRLLNSIEQSDVEFSRVRDLMIQMRDGDGSSAAHYTIMKAQFGFNTDAEAKAAFDELDSAYSKTSGNGSVTNVRAARDQVVAKLR